MKSALFDRYGIPHGFGSFPEPVPSEFREAWEKLKPRFKQVHGTRVSWFGEAEESVGEADGFFTDSPGLFAGVVTADCVPVLFARKDGKAVGAVHAGWRGMIGRILPRAVEGIRERGDSPSDWIAAIGPSIGACCFEVDEELSGRFVSEFQGIMETSLIRPSFRHLDLSRIARDELAASGLNHIDFIQVCTRCAQDDSGAFRLHSHRRSPGAGRQVSVVRRIP